MNIESKSFAVAAQISPQSITGATVTSGWVALGSSYRIAALILCGALAGTVDWKIEQAQDGSGTGAKTLLAGTQFAATDDDKNKQIDCDVTAVDTENGFGFVRLSITASAAACLVCGALIFADPRVLS